MSAKRMERETVEARTLDILLSNFMPLKKAEPLKVSFEKVNLVIKCDSNSVLGFNTIKVKTKKGSEGIERKVYDKYIFAEIKENEKVKEVQTFTVPFYMPWYVADLTFLWPKERTYCFVNAPFEIEEELGNETSTGLGLVTFSDQVNECPGNSVVVCFSSSNNCDIKIMSSFVEKNGKDLPYINKETLYAAIFSDPELYFCNLKRLAKRISLQTEIYKEKITTLTNCETVNDETLDSLDEAASQLALCNTPTCFGRELKNLKGNATALNDENRYARCQIF